MGNSSNRDHDLVIYIETEKNFYNSGSNIEGVVFVQAKKNFAFDALYLRVEGIIIFMQVINGASGSKAVPKIVKDTQEVKIFTQLNTNSKSTRKRVYKLEIMPILFHSNSPKISQARFSLKTMNLKSNTN